MAEEGAGRVEHGLGERLFCRYAFSPNELGYCGPAGAAGIRAVAAGEPADLDVRRVARGFSGAWVYQALIGRMLDRDPLDATVVRGYWTGNPETAGIDRTAFWDRLIEIIGPRAGSYWRHLDAGLAAEAAPSHAFHVLGVYPWSRLLDAGRPEPLGVLRDCCVRPATVTGIGADGVLALDLLDLRYDGSLRWEADGATGVESLFDDDLRVGEQVAVHWGRVCDRLTATEAEELTAQLAAQVDRTNHRLRGG